MKLIHISYLFYALIFTTPLLTLQGQERGASSFKAPPAYSGSIKTTNAAHEIKASLKLKRPGNLSQLHSLTTKTRGEEILFNSAKTLPVILSGMVKIKDNSTIYTVRLEAKETIYFNYKQSISVGNMKHKDNLFLMPGFWYRQNLRSPKKAPSFHTSDSWLVREDRLSSPLTGVFSEENNSYCFVARRDDIKKYASSQLNHGEVVLSGTNDLGFTGFENVEGKTCISVGFPYVETPRSYVRKSTLAPSIHAFDKLEKGQVKILTWEVIKGRADSFADFTQQVWEYAYDTYVPKKLNASHSEDFVKKTLSNFYKESYTQTNDLNYYSGVHLFTDKGGKNDRAEIGFLGRVLLNAFFALEYAEQNENEILKVNANSIFDSYLKNGFTSNGCFRESIKYKNEKQSKIYSIRRQSEGIYAILHYLKYEKRQGRKHPEWERRIKDLLSNLISLQNEDGSFPRKFDDNNNIKDASGGSTPSATLPLVMASKYFKDKTYLEHAKKTGVYLETEIISKSDYFSSTLDANCEDKEASLYASTAMYYLALVSKGKEKTKYTTLAKKAAYFALSWYYTWDVPFARGQMLGDLGFKSRGWGNVSTENNHIDVFIFEFADVLYGLAELENEPRFSAFADVIKSSMTQLLPYSGNMCGISKVGYYPEVVQHTNWDYGKNGKGFYNIHFAPGWTVASLWQLLNKNTAQRYFKN